MTRAQTSRLLRARETPLADMVIKASDRQPIPSPILFASLRWQARRLRSSRAMLD